MMKYFKTKEEKKSFFISAAIILVLLLLFRFVSVINVVDPPQESGIAVNFGNTDVGSGRNIQPKPTKVTPKPQPQPKVEEPAPPQTDNVATQDNTEAPVIKSDPEVKKPAKEPAKSDPKPKEEVKKPDPKPDKSVLDVIGNVTGSDPKDGENNDGEGPGDGPGNKGQLNGNPYANTYYGTPGNGKGGKGFGLSGRGKVAGRGVEPECFETGTVIVEIEVDRQGVVRKATAGKRGTTNKASCLLDAAEASAKTYRFTPAPDANAIQIGFVEVIFKVGQ
jgi:outer membrane biosynthesis protein TonB